MKRKIKKGAASITASLLILSVAPTAFAEDFMMNTMNATNFAATSTSSGNDFLSDQMNQLQTQQQQQLQTQQQQQQEKVKATGYVIKDGDKYFLTANNERYQIITQKGDILAVLPVVAGKEMPVQFIGQYNATTKQLFVEGMTLLKQPSDTMKAALDEALKEFKKTQDISGIGKVVKVDGKYKFSVNSKTYSILTDSSDIEVVLPLISDKELKIELIGKLDEEALTFTAKRLNFKDTPSQELINQIDLALLVNKDGKEIDATGTVVKTEGDYFIKIFGEKYKLNYTREDITRVLPVVADTDLAVKVTGTLHLEAKNLDAKKVDIVEQPSDGLRAKINEALKGYEEGNVDARGYIIKKEDTFYLKVEDKEYKISATKDDLKAFLGAVSGEDLIIQLSGFISNVEKTFDAKSGLVIGTPTANQKEKIKSALDQYMTKPENGKTIDATGYIGKDGSNYFIEVNFDRYKITSDKTDLMAALGVLADKNLNTAVTGVIDTANFTLKASKLKVLDVPSTEIQNQLKAAVAPASNSGTGTTTGNATNSNGLFGNMGNFGNFDFSKFPSFSQFAQGGTAANGSTSGTGTGATNPSSLWGNFDFSKFANFGSLSSQLGNSTTGTTGTSPTMNFSNLSNMMQQFFGNKNVNAGTLTGSTSPMQLPSLSFDQIQQVLGKMGSTTTGTSGTTSSSSSPSGSTTSGSTSGSSSTNGFAAGEPNGSGFSSGGN